MRKSLPGFSPFSLHANKTIFVVLFLMPCIYSFAQVPVSGNFTINAKQPTAGKNFQTFTEAVLSLTDGINGPVVFNVAPNSGPYNEQVIMSAVPGVSATNSITFNVNGNTITYASTNPTSRAVVKLDGAKHVTIDSAVILPVTIPDPSSFGWGVALLRNADSNTIRKCTIEVAADIKSGQNNYGIMIGTADDFPGSNGLNYCDGNIITKNTIKGGYCGIIVDNFGKNFGQTYSPINNNQITFNKISNFQNAGIYLIWNGNTLVEGNDITGGLIDGDNVGIYLNETNQGTRIIGNRIHNIYSTSDTTHYSFTAINLAYCTTEYQLPVIIANNAIYDIRNDNTQYGIHINNSKYVNVYHNTIVLDTAGAASSSSTYGIYYEDKNAYVNIKNNLVIVKRTGSGSKYGLYVNSAGIGFASDYNDIIVGSGVSYGRYGGTNYSTLAAWQPGTSQDIHSTTEEPVFANAANGILKPTSAALDNAGIFTGIGTDINKDGRNNKTPDIGAYEFLTPPCGKPVTGGNAVAVSAATDCAGGMVTLNLSGNSFGSGQTYQWQNATTLNGTYTNVGSPQSSILLDVPVVSPFYYRAILTCVTGDTDTSTALLISITQPSSGTYTINAKQPAGNGNYQSITDAFRSLKCGIGGPVVFKVAPGSGPYNEQLIIGEITGASATNTITLKGNSETISFTSTDLDERAVIKLNGADHIIIDSLVIAATGTTSSQYGFGVQLINNADSNVVSNCTIKINTTSTSGNYAGIVINSSTNDAIGASGTASGCDYNKITGNTITGGYYGITLYSDPALTKIVYDTISYNKVFDSHNNGIVVTGTDHAVIEGNEISRPVRTASSSTFNAIYLNNPSTALTVSKNIIHATFTSMATNSGATNGIYSNNCDGTATLPNIISNNVLYDLGGTGAITGLNNSGSDYTRYYHNSVSINTTATATITSTARAIYQTTNATGLEFKNNNITVKRTSSGVNHGFYMNATGTTYISRNNNYFITGSTASNGNRVGYTGGTSYTTVADWRTAAKKDTGSLGEDPSYADLANGNLKPTNANLDNGGIATSITTDIKNIIRSTTTPDIGAYEFAGVLPVGLVSFTAKTNVTDVLVSWATATEVNSKLFVIESSIDGSSFTNAGTVNAAGSSSNQLTYNFVDKGAALTASRLYYRLKMIDIDGSTTYSVIAVVETGTLITSINAYPNPFVSELFAAITSDAAGKATINLKDITGRTVASKIQQVKKGDNRISIEGAGSLPKGMYLLTVNLNGNNYIVKVAR